MNKKLFLLILIPALLLIGAYVFTRYYLERAVARDEEKIATGVNHSDSAATKQSASLDLRPIFIGRLQQLVAKTSNHIYDLSVGNLTIDILSSRVNFKNVVLTPDKKRADSLSRMGLAPAETFSFFFESLQVEGINVDDAITSKTMDYKLVRLTNPVFHIYRAAIDANDPTDEFAQRFLKEMKKLSVQNLLVEGGRIIIHNKGKSTVLKDVNIEMKDILIDSATRTDSARFLFAKKARLSFKGYQSTGKGQYKLAIDKVNVEVHEQILTLTNLSFGPPVNKKEFARRQKFSNEYYQVSFPSITVTGVNWWSLLNEDEVVAKDITIPAGKLLIYLDRSLPPRSKMGNFPAQLLMKLPVKINIDKVNVNDMDLAYEEFNPVSQQSGTIHVNDIFMSVRNVSNIKEKILNPVTAGGKAVLMGKIPIRADFVFSRADHRSGKFTARIRTVNEFDGSLLNPFAMPMGMVKLEKGQLQKVDADIQGDQLKASGNITILYKDLKLQLLEKDKGETALDKKDVTSFLANTFILKKDNPKEGEALRKVQADFDRIREGGFFMLVWKTILTGALKTIGAPAKIATKRVVPGT